MDLATFVQLFVNGLGKGAVYALLALGFVIIFKATEVVNFAHGSLVLVGGYVVYALKDTLGWPAAALVGIVSAALAGLILERGLLANARSADHNSLALLTIGVDVIITEEIVRRVGADIPFIGDPYDSQPIQLAGVTIFRTQAIALVVGAVLITAFFLAFRFSNWGVAMRAQAENKEAAALMGIRSSRVTATAWLVAGALAGVAVLFMATQDFSGAGLGRGTHAIALIAFPAAILGGLDSTAGAIVGGLIVGVTEALTSANVDFLPFLGPEFSKSAVFLVMLVVLVIRPSGLFGTKELSRV
ncbi:MAG: branched-chain amino acid ABC transporter permease [Pseudonocardia sp.]|nr:branched-chain amino acid ABC transporter permease [Pseudonocardia sp.]